VIESIFVIMALHSRQTFPSNIRLKTLFQSVEPDALLLEGFIRSAGATFNREQMCAKALSTRASDSKPALSCNPVYVYSQITDHFFPADLFLRKPQAAQCCPEQQYGLNNRRSSSASPERMLAISDLRSGRISSRASISPRSSRMRLSS